MYDTIKEITNFIFVEHKPEKCDAIMILGGSHPELAEKAANFWNDGYAPIIFAAGGVSVKTGKFPGPKSKSDIYNKDYQTEAEFFEDVLILNNVDADAIIKEDKSGTTRENAMFTAKIANDKELRINKAILICKTFHARRSLMYYQLAFPNTKFLLSCIESYEINKNNWYKNEYGIRRVLGELARCGNQFTEDMIQIKDKF